jgi:type IV secretory system VirB8-like protein
MTTVGAKPWDDLTAEEQDKYGRVRYEQERRDGNSEWREWRAYRIAGGLILTVIVLAIGFVFFAIRGQRVQAMVQQVQLEGERVVAVGRPIDLLDYTPQEGEWRNMLTHWVTKRHWRDQTEDDPQAVRAHYDWRWLYLHTCGAARKQLEKAEQVEKPFEPSKKRVKVDIETFNKDPIANRYHVFWTSTTTEQYSPEPKVERWTTTFLVDRVEPKTAAEATLNNLGQCVAGLHDEPRS